MTRQGGLHSLPSNFAMQKFQCVVNLPAPGYRKFLVWIANCLWRRLCIVVGENKKSQHWKVAAKASDNLKQIFKLPHSIVVESYVKAFQYKVINSILYTNTKLYKIGFRTNDLCTFCDNQPESLTHLFYHCSRSKQFWIEFELYWCLISNQRIRLCLENVLFGILTENACPLLQLLNYFIIIGKLYLWDCRSKQILPNIYGFRAKIIAKYETEEKISNKEFFKRKWILTPYLS